MLADARADGFVEGFAMQWLQVDRAIDFGKTDFAANPRLSNVYLTFLNRVFGVPDASFGDSTGIIPELLV